MKNLLPLAALLAAPLALAKVPHRYLVEVCDDEKCGVLTVQGNTVGFIGTKELGADPDKLIIVNQDTYDAMASTLERISVEDLEIGLLARDKPKKKKDNKDRLDDIVDIINSLTGGGTGGGGTGGGNTGGNDCGDCHTDGKHGHHPPTNN